MRIPGVAIATLLTIALAACGGDSGGPGGGDDTAQARVIHAVPDAPALDVTVDGEVVVDGISYLQATNYAPVPSGSVEMTLTVSTNGVELARATPTLTTDAEYSILAAGPALDAELMLIPDDNTPPTQNFKLRVINAASSVPAVDVHLTEVNEDPTVALLQNVTLGTVSAYLDRAESDGDIVVTTAGTLGVLVNTGATEFVPGRVLTFIIADAPGGGGPLTFQLLTDREGQASP